MKNSVLTVAILAIFFVILTEKAFAVNIIVALIVGLAVFRLNNTTAPLTRYVNGKTIVSWLMLIPLLFFEVIKANFQVAMIALSVQMPIDPQLVNYESRLHDDLLLTILANVITLTPGTMTIDMEQSTLKIHCLNADYAAGLNGMMLETLLFKIEGGLNG